VVARCTEVQSGARNVDNILTNTMLPSISTMLLESLAGGERPGTVRVAVDAAGDLQYNVSPVARSADFAPVGAADSVESSAAVPA